MQHPRPVLKAFDLTKGLDGLLVFPSDIANRLEGWPLPLLVMDFETNGSSAARDEIVEIAAIRIETGRQVLFSTVLKTKDPGRTDMHGISEEDQERAPSFADVVPILRLMGDDCTLVSHHTTLDRFVAEEMERIGGKWNPPYIDSLKVVKAVYPDRKGRGTNTLYNLCDNFGIPNLGYHLATGDVLAVAYLCATMNEAKPQEVKAAIEKVTKRRDGVTTWPNLPMPEKLLAAVRMPKSPGDDHEPTPASKREDFIPEDEPANRQVFGFEDDAPAEPAVKASPILFAFVFLGLLFLMTGVVFVVVMATSP